jgi:hypothetical protein
MSCQGKLKLQHSINIDMATSFKASEVSNLLSLRAGFVESTKSGTIFTALHQTNRQITVRGNTVVVTR